ncbi:hypothetical protein [Candidatus Ichthyocystis hellenicum]|uniref:hypothetical protein n=1 Tax=Candidatus Ichthyocystis hellenicum TaxID=1561003 RepID=UPI000B8340E6|nr:hypothetical protein [Candidatus Ichthyocystis hellenicum]
MQIYFGGNGVPEDENVCSCTVCCSPDIQRALAEIDRVSLEAGRAFADMSSVDSSTYTSLVMAPNTHTSEKVRNSSCFSAKLMIALAVLLTFLIVCTIFAVLAYKGMVHVPGINPDVIINLAKLSGVVLGVYFFRCLLGLGYLMGGRAGSDEYRATNALNRLKVRELAMNQKEKWDNLDELHRELQSNVTDLRKSVTESSYKNVNHSLRMDREVASAKHLYSQLDEVHTVLVMELSNLRNANAEISSRHAALAEQNTRLSEENDLLKSNLATLAR